MEQKKKYIHELKGENSRLDEIQAGILNIKLKRLEADNKKRQAIAKKYSEEIQNPYLTLPQMPKNIEEHVWHIYPIRTKKRNQLQEYLKTKGIETIIHYPTPPHRQSAYSELSSLSLPITEKIHKEILSLPMSPILAEKEINYIIEAINTWQKTLS